MLNPISTRTVVFARPHISISNRYNFTRETKTLSGNIPPDFGGPTKDGVLAVAQKLYPGCNFVIGASANCYVLIDMTASREPHNTLEGF